MRVLNELHQVVGDDSGVTAIKIKNIKSKEIKEIKLKGQL